MKPRQAHRLATHPEQKFLAEVSRGCMLSVRNSEALLDAAGRSQIAGSPRGQLILLSLSEEEASKALILIDAVRCPAPADRYKHLRKFKDHRWRVAYSWSCSMSPQSFDELRHLAQRWLSDKYSESTIEGNLINELREGSIYVDYVETDSGLEWDAPDDNRLAWIATGPMLPPDSLTLSQSLERVGAFTEDGLCAIAALWKDLTPASLTSASLRSMNLRTVDELRALGFSDSANKSDDDGIAKCWAFPMWSLPFRIR